MFSGCVIDTAGGRVGGAGRFRDELERFLSGSGHHPAPRVIGTSSFVTPPWLIRREAIALSSQRVVAANNVSFVLAGKERWVLARNANHFLTSSEWAKVSALHPRSFHRQISTVRRSLRRADTIVAPSSEMAERIAMVVPDVARRLVVRFHPFTPSVQRRAVADPFILVPIVWSRYKQLDRFLTTLLDAIQDKPDHAVVWTASPEQVADNVRQNPQLQLVGALGHGKLAELYASAAAIFYPTEIESFGYPLAEARALGIPIIAQDTARTREVAGAALRGFQSGDADSLVHATDAALGNKPDPDPAPFDPTTYFRWLLGEGSGA